MNLRDFANPPKHFGPAPYWSWNDRLDQAELIRQIGEMDQQGWGGFLIWHHDGLEVPYLSPELMAYCGIAVREAKKRGMRVWICDEHIGPSGQAGGLIAAKGAEYRMKLLVYRPHSRPMGIAESIKCFAGAKASDGGIRLLEDISDEEHYSGEANIFLHFYEWTDPLGNLAIVHGGSSYVDLLNPMVVEAFLETTHETYLRALGADFGKTVQGMATEIPSYTMPSFNRYVPRPSVPWTSAFPALFLERFGYSLTECLPSLFLDVGNYRKVRCDFWSMVSDRFREVYVRAVKRWCKDHGVLFVGNYWGEEHLHWMVQWAGPVMPLLAVQDLPCTTHVGRNIDDPLGVKQADSVAAQFGRDCVLAGIHEQAGESLTLEDQRWIGNWICVLGGNLLLPNRACYSLRGMRKHRNPPSVFYQQPYWPYQHLLSDYFRRLGFALRRGTRVADVLVLLPMASMWSLFRPMHTAAGGVKSPDSMFDGTDLYGLEFSQQFSALCNTLLRLHRDFHLGDEKLLEEHAYVEGEVLRVGKANYRVILVPPSITWNQSTVELLRQFARAGGKVVAVKPLPWLADCVEAEDVVPPGTIIAENTASSLREILNAALLPELEIDTEDVWYHHRRDGKDDIVFLANVNNKASFETRIRMRGEGIFKELDPADGQVRLLPAEVSSGYTSVSLQFPPAGSHLLVFNEGISPQSPAQPSKRQVTRTMPLAATWEFERKDPNALVLDYCELKVEDRSWRPRQPVFKNDRFLYQLGSGVHYTARYRFRLADLPQGADVFLALDDPERFGIRINGHNVEPGRDAWWVDHSLKRVDIGASLRPGENIVELVSVTQDKNTMYSQIETQLEPIYVCGDFSVSETAEGFVLTREEKKIQSGDLVRQGYPFYPGKVEISQEIEVPNMSARSFLELTGLQATVAEVRVNGSLAGQVAWQPHRVDLTELLHAGRNKISIGLVNTLFNLLGPHHNPHHDPVKGVSELVFSQAYTDATGWKDTYTLVPFGIDSAKILWE